MALLRPVPGPISPPGQVAAAPRLGHVALAASDPELVATFFGALLGMQIVRRASNPMIGDAVLLSGDPVREDHELVFHTGSAANHIAFRVDTLEQLRALYRQAKQLGRRIPYASDSGTAVRFFLRDPEGNGVEIYVAGGDPRRDTPLLTDPDEIERLILGR